MEKIDDYLYYIKYDDIDYSAGVDYSKRFKMPLGGCSSVYTNGLLGRNYDWYYDGTNPDEAISIQDIINSIINRLTTIEENL